MQNKAKITLLNRFFFAGYGYQRPDRVRFHGRSTCRGDDTRPRTPPHPLRSRRRRWDSLFLSFFLYLSFSLLPLLLFSSLDNEGGVFSLFCPSLLLSLSIFLQFVFKLNVIIFILSTCIVFFPIL